MKRTPTLWSLVGIYFNQDWLDDYGTESASVDAFVLEAPDDHRALLNEIDWVLEHFTTETELHDYLESQGSEYVPPTHEGGYRGWLTRIADRVRAATA